MQKGWLISLLVGLTLVVGVEGAAIAGFFDPWLYGSEQASSQGGPAQPNTGSQSGGGNGATAPAVPPATGPRTATRTFSVTGSVTTPGASATSDFTLTEQLTATNQPDGTTLVTVASAQSNTGSTNMATEVIDADGSIYLSSFSAGTAQGAIDCTGHAPSYLAVGKDSDTASLSCTVATGGKSIPITFAGSAKASEPTAVTSGSKTYQARVTTIQSTVGAGGGPAKLGNVLRITAAPGIGTIKLEGSLGALLTSQFGGAFSSQTVQTLTSMSDDQFFLPGSAGTGTSTSGGSQGRQTLGMCARTQGFSTNYAAITDAGQCNGAQDNKFYDNCSFTPGVVPPWSCQGSPMPPPVPSMPAKPADESVLGLCALTTSGATNYFNAAVTYQRCSELGSEAPVRHFDFYPDCVPTPGPLPWSCSQ